MVHDTWIEWSATLAAELVWADADFVGDLESRGRQVVGLLRGDDRGGGIPRVLSVAIVRVVRDRIGLDDTDVGEGALRVDLTSRVTEFVLRAGVWVAGGVV